MSKRDWPIAFFVFLIGSLAFYFYWKLLYPPYLTFSDAAKFADVARNFVNGLGLQASYAPFDKNLLGQQGLLPIAAPPLFPLAIALFYKIFGVGDLAVILTSAAFYLGSAVILYLLGNKLFSRQVGLLAALAFIFDPAMLNYASIGANETLFIFELLLAFYLIVLNTRLSLVLSLLVFFSLYWTRQSAIIYLAIFWLMLVYLKTKNMKTFSKSLVLGGVIYLSVEVVLNNFSRGFFIYSPLSSFFFSMANFSPAMASTEALRGGMVSSGFTMMSLLKKLFYDLYNYYKSLPQIISPYLAAIYILSLFRWEKDRTIKGARITVVLMIITTLLVAAATLPLYRYLHPIIPFVYLLAAEMLVWILQKLIIKKEYLEFVSFGLIFVFLGGQTLGHIFLDSRFLKSKTLTNQPPVYAQLGYLLRENTQPPDFVVTNLDAWGSWYGQRKTIWFPLEPEQLETKNQLVDAIYLTSYKMDDENYKMGESWRQAFLNPEAPADAFLAKNYKLAGVFQINPQETYEEKGARAVLFIRK